MGDRPQVLHKLGLGHANAEVLDCERLRLVVRRNVDLEFRLIVENGLLRHLKVALLLKGI
jgi:hypothetical protein